MNISKGFWIALIALPIFFSSTSFAENKATAEAETTSKKAPAVNDNTEDFDSTKQEVPVIPIIPSTGSTAQNPPTVPSIPAVPGSTAYKSNIVGPPTIPSNPLAEHKKMLKKLKEREARGEVITVTRKITEKGNSKGGS